MPSGSFWEVSVGSKYNYTSHFQGRSLLLPCLRGMCGLFCVSNDEKRGGKKMSELQKKGMEHERLTC